jgi:1-deoxy-D-xylulose-5-phosphate reductoisomerase
MKGVTVLGSTGSIGMNTLDVLARHPDKYRLVAITANTCLDRVIKQCIAWQPQFAVMADEDSADILRASLSNKAPDVEVLAGQAGLIRVASLAETDYVMAAIVGAAGLLPTLAAARAGKRILLANKESLVMAGRLFMDVVKENSAELLPIDSEHNALFQCMPANFQQGLVQSGVTRMLITASGGPFRTVPLAELDKMTPAQACAHPNWEMGQKISVDSATMMNKGLEVIEACWLFNTTPAQINVVVHPQSIIHSLVEYTDGSVLAQLGNPDMRAPIAHALAWPERMASGVQPLNLFDIARLDFEQVDTQRFPCLRLATEAMAVGGTATAILNAANEEAVSGFLGGRIKFTDIAKTVEVALENLSAVDADSLDVILAADQSTREYARNYIEEIAA